MSRKSISTPGPASCCGQLLGTVLPLPAQAFSYYLPAAAALLGVLGLACVFLRREPKADLAAAMVLAIAFTVLFSPHYSWYFAWIIPFLCCYPSVAAIYLTCAASWLHLGHWPPSLKRWIADLWRGRPLALPGNISFAVTVERKQAMGRAVPA